MWFVSADDGDRVVSRISDWLAGGGCVLLMTDYDGTLTPIVGDPGEAWLPDGVRRDLQALAQSAQCRVALISGRDLEDLRARAPLAATIYAGCHGLEIAGPDFSFCHPEAEARRPMLEAVSRDLRARAPGIEGTRVEPKRLAVAVHYRHVPAAVRPELGEAIAGVVQRAGGGLSIVHGMKVVEILPEVGWDKGACAMWIHDWARRRLSAPLLTVYLGDDRTDEQAFEALAGLGVTVRVGARRQGSLATYQFDDVARVHQLLAAMASIVGPWRSP